MHPLHLLAPLKNDPVSSPSSTLFSETKPNAHATNSYIGNAVGICYFFLLKLLRIIRETRTRCQSSSAQTPGIAVNSVLKAYLVQTSCIMSSGEGNRQYTLQRCCDRTKRISLRHTSQCLLYYAPSPHLDLNSCFTTSESQALSSVLCCCICSILWFIDTTSFPPCI